MSDVHPLPLVGHDMPQFPVIRARVFKKGQGWYWSYESDYGDGPQLSILSHGPFADQPEAYASAWRTVEAL